MKILILAGGTGTRLWPVSRIFNPKQFTKFKGMGKSAFQITVEMVAKKTDTANIFIVTNKEYRYFVSGQLGEIGIKVPESNIILEPSFMNTLHAVSSGVFAIVDKWGKEEHIFVIPSNSAVAGYDYFFSDLLDQDDYIFTDGIFIFGIKPVGAYIDYGYIKPGKNKGAWFSVDKFIEKPTEEAAKTLVKDGCYYNSGILMFRGEVFIESLKDLETELYDAFVTKKTLDEIYEVEVRATIERAILEKSKNLSVIPLEEVWDNMEEFSSFYKQYQEKKDKFGNISFNEDIFLNSSDNFIYSEGEKAIGVIGVNNLVVIDQPDALLVCHNKSTHRVREVATILKNRGDSRADYHTICYRPWGSFTVLEEGVGYKIKRITVLPGKKLSYQMHYNRSEHWVMVSGTSTVIKDDKEHLVKAGESIFISVGEKHRLENRGKTVLEIIEVQIGSYLGEDDIVRFEDEYGR